MVGPNLSTSQEQKCCKYFSHVITLFNTKTNNVADNLNKPKTIKFCVLFEMVAKHCSFKEKNNI